MNTEILNQYHVKFIILQTEIGQKALVETSAPQNMLSRYIADYFIQSTPDGMRDGVLDNISRAQSNQPFDPTLNDHEMASIIVGAQNCVLHDYDEAKEPESIPTNDLVEIIESWIEWIETNNLQAKIL